MAINNVILCVLDGWGARNDRSFNAPALGKTPNYDLLINRFPNSQLKAHGGFVGLSDNQVGNSEVGHITLGSGRVVPMNLTKINKGIQSGSLVKNRAVKEFIKCLKSTNGTAHLLGLVSSGGVHAHIDHMVYMANFFSSEGIKVKLHCFLDGRDAPPKSATTIIRELESRIPARVNIATLIGRFFAMDRDNRWDRIEKCYRLLVEAKGQRFDSAIQGIESNYEKGKTDEFIEPIVIDQFDGFSNDIDGLFCLNFRSDRVRELMEALFSSDFKKFKRTKKPRVAVACSIVEYQKSLKNYVKSVFKPEIIENCLGECLSQHKMSQLRIAETEKYPHITFFFNGGKESVSKSEERFLVSSPKVLTYDTKPEMSAFEITEKLTSAINSKMYNFILVNYANPDMVGHTGNLEATIRACETVDICLGRVLNAVKKTKSVLLVTSDHGNSELMFDLNNKSPHTAHTLNLVPFIAVGLGHSSFVTDGALSDVAPTVLDLLGLKKPKEMTGESLIGKDRSC